MYVNEFSDKAIAKRISLWSTCISNTFNKFLDVLMNGLFNKLSPCHDLDHKIEEAKVGTRPFKASYRLNQREFEKLLNQIND
jgi:hypothetical protein